MQMTSGMNFGDCAHLHRIWRRSVKKITTSTCSNIEIAGLLKKKRKNNYDYKTFGKLRVSGFSHGVLEACTILMAVCIAI